MLGKEGQGQVAITGEISRRQVHIMRAETDAILVGIGTALADDPELTCRLPGLETRSPARIVLDPQARLPLSSKLVRSAGDVPVIAAVAPDADSSRKSALQEAGVKLAAVELFEGRIALPELLEDLAGQGISTLLMEGGARTAREFLMDGLVDRIALFTGANELGGGGVASPLSAAAVPAGFHQVRAARFGDDHYSEWVRAG
jgi:diaminohydroxyphosphoribosylaminopyrimidine deaminase/5-amino-6-(5-phosphoribosylamino)uracil reductase